MDVETLAKADDAAAWALLAAYCCRPLSSSESICAPLVGAAGPAVTPLLAEALLVELVELVLDVELDDVSSGGGPPPWWWWW